MRLEVMWAPCGVGWGDPTFPCLTHSLPVMLP